MLADELTFAGEPGGTDQLMMSARPVPPLVSGSDAMARLTALPARLSRPAPRLAAAPKVADPFYLSSEWRQLKERRKLDADYYAARRRAKPGEKLILDHIVERKDGGAELDPANTEWLTHGEHNAKTARARAKRSREMR